MNQSLITECNDWVSSYLRRQAIITRSVKEDEVESFIKILWSAYLNNNKIFVIGNGGSAANASHFAVDLGKGASDALNKAYGSRNKRFKVESLSDNIPWLTALGNDYSYADVFAERLDNEGHAFDVLVGVSVSGTSPNLHKAFLKAGQMNMTRVALTRKSASLKENSIANNCELNIKIDTEEYGICEDAQMSILHAACYYFMAHASELVKQERSTNE